MQLEDKIAISLIGILVIGWFVTSVTAQQYSQQTGPINASISQPISVTFSDVLKNGIFFTNGTQQITQYPITDVSYDNNATHNYACSGSGTCYNVSSASTNTVNITIYLSACDNLKNGTNAIYLTWDSNDNGQGAFFANGTSATEPTLSPTQPWAFLVDEFKPIFVKLAPNQVAYFRFWLDPWPNNAPSGIYNTTYLIRAYEETYNPASGAGQC